MLSETLFKSTLSEMYNEIVQDKKGAIKLTLNVSNFSSSNLTRLSIIDFDHDSEEKQLDANIHRLRTRFDWIL